MFEQKNAVFQKLDELYEVRSIITAPRRSGKTMGLCMYAADSLLHNLSVAIVAPSEISATYIHRILCLLLLGSDHPNIKQDGRTFWKLAKLDSEGQRVAHIRVFTPEKLTAKRLRALNPLIVLIDECAMVHPETWQIVEQSIRFTTQIFGVTTPMPDVELRPDYIVVAL